MTREENCKHCPFKSSAPRGECPWRSGTTCVWVASEMRWSPDMLSPAKFFSRLRVRARDLLAPPEGTIRP